MNPKTLTIVSLSKPFIPVSSSGSETTIIKRPTKILTGMLVTKTLLFAGEGSGLYAADGGGGNKFRSYDKTTGEIISESSQYFDQLTNMKEVYVLGHSLSSVDLPYFHEILKRIDKATVKWKISFYNKKELIHHSEVFKQFGIDTTLIEFDRLNNIDTQQMSLFPSDDQ